MRDLASRACCGTRGRLLALLLYGSQRCLPEEVSMSPIQRVLLGLTVAMLLTAPAAAQKVSYDAGDADFTGINTFAFKDSPVDENATDQTAHDSLLITERTRAAIAAQLEARGLRQ